MLAGSLGTLLAAIVALVLLTACVNVAGMLRRAQPHDDVKSPSGSPSAPAADGWCDSS